ncbi:hypothetical protein QPK87_07720 [Kamptonema cortianum]|nr:hypothetical protein [Kamptonema cortianum]MDL5053853.1 hypothetical protein [Oscillatoria laete-virens NRMC-F 0139]
MTRRRAFSEVLSGVFPLVSLTAWASLLVWFYFDPRMNALTSPFLHRWILLAGMFLVVIVVFRFVEIARFGLAALNCGEECRDSPELTSGKVIGFCALMIPVGIALVVDPTSFSGQFVRNRGVEMTAPGMIAPGVPQMTREEIESVLQEGVVYDTDVVEILMLADDSVARGVLEKKAVSMTAQIVYPEKSASTQIDPGGVFYAVRLYMLCCAADARPIGVLVRTHESLDVPEMSWGRLTGILNYVNYNGRMVPEITMTEYEKVPAPEEQYLY